MSWAAANAPKAPKDRLEDSGIYSTTNNNINNKKRTTETVEAALSRLSKAYTSSMECIGALQQTNRMLQKKQDDASSFATSTTFHDASRSVLERVANAARTTFETAILLDPLVLPHVPTVYETILSFLERKDHLDDDHDDERWKLLQVARPEPPVLTSEAHKTTIRELAYLSLVNYSDLLQMCCNCGEDYKKDKQVSSSCQTSLLDSGVVTKIQTLQEGGRCCWKGESQEDTQRLAVTALCDASTLDASDPVLWLKLACASRNLENMLLHQLTTVGRSKHRRLQRYALEQGSQALPPCVPPNRVIQRALRELLAEPEPQAYISTLDASKTTDEDSVKLVLDLPRYSWSVLGRMLLRVCREGTDVQYGHKHHHHHHHHNPYSLAPPPIRFHRPTLFGSPRIELSLSPTLVLPVRVLGRICLFLDSGAIRRFESTCRALSVSIMSARAVMEDEKHREAEIITREREQLPDVPTKGAVEGGGNDKLETSSRAVINKTSQEVKPKEKGRIKSSREHSRSSQRLRSQQITSGKKMERFGKRQSFEYCFLAATTGCSAEDHKAAREGTKIDESVSRLLPGMQARFAQQQSTVIANGKRREPQAPIADSSLASFVEKWSGRNSGPMDLVTKYLVHVAMNVEEVFASDPSGTVALTSCLLSCFETLLGRSGYLEPLVPVFFKGVPQTGSSSKSLEGFALDVLHGELILKQCDRITPLHVAYDDGSNMIGVIVPRLYQACTELEKGLLQAGQDFDEGAHRHFATLKIRCNWLLAGFYLWKSGIAQNIYEAQDAENEGISFINESLKGFESPYLVHVRALQTPHLVSPARTESYWRELSQLSLRKYRDEIQASTVVKVVREKFQDLIAKINQSSDEFESRLQLTEANSKALAETGEKLYERYKPDTDDPESKHGELIEDFLSVHGNTLMASEEDRTKHEPVVKIESFLPLEQVDLSSLETLTNPSILTMLTICIMVVSSNRERLQQLLVRLVVETRKMHNDLLRRIASSRLHAGEAGGFSDSDDDSLMSGDSDDPSVSHKNIDERRALQCGHLVAFLIERIAHCISMATEEVQRDFAISHECTNLLETALEMSSEWFENTSKHLLQENIADLCIFQSVRALVGRLYHSRSRAKDHQQRFAMKYVGALSRITVVHQRIFSSLVTNHGDRSSRVVKQRLCLRRAEYVGSVTSEIGIVLSRYLCTMENDVLLRSSVLLDKGSSAGGSMRGMSSGELKCLIDSATWFWRFASQIESDSHGSEIPVCSSFDRPLVKALRVPVASMVVGLCGAAARSRDIESSVDGIEDPLCLSEFYDTDDSANGWQSDNEETNVGKLKTREFLRVACHVVQCINLVLDKIDDKGALSLVPVGQCAGLGPLLPLVASRVLNFFADSILSTIADDDRGAPDLWASQYPITTRTIGEILDSNLYKVYRWMYGFVLIGEKGHLQSSGKDLASSTAPIIDLAETDCRLENLSSAACLYRCIVRAYRSGRRSPPKRALEFLSAALPAVEQSEKSSIIRDFVFSADSYLSLEQVKRIVTRADEWDSVFSSIRDQLTKNEEDGDAMTEPMDDTAVAMRIRRGMLSHLADGVLPMNANENCKGKSDQAQDDDRVVTAKNEEELAKKFDAIMDAICLSDARSSRSWYRAAQCLSAKAEMIADRLGRTRDVASIEHFTVPLPQHRIVRGVQLAALLKDHDDTDSFINANWIHYLGNELSAYVKYTWASHDSLRACTDSLGEDCRDLMMEDSTGNEKRSQYKVWKSIDALHRKGDYLSWQEAWGGMFVFVLRKLSVRLMAVALYLLQSEEDQTAEDKVLMSELCESLGVIFYSELSGSQSYGYPMRSMGEKRKRDLAMIAKVCFEGAVEFVNEPETTRDGNEEVHTTWDLIFILGKCDEKIAGTYILQAFSNQKELEVMRLYERHTASALSHYAAALAQVKKIEEDGGAIVDQSGGSAHGRTEIEYRMLAVRLKCLITSAVRGEDEFDRAEEEALRLTGCHWFHQPEDLDSWKKAHIRDRLWAVLADVVAGLAQCRADQPFFHRSVYRHAQALMWAPVLCDPESAKGSLGSVPPSQGHLIKGLNSSTSVAQSAETIISSLFDKKRSQLCAVWVTAAPSPFQVVNSSIRKYDSLRGKYISSYIECLRLCHRRSKLETFLKWLSSTPRDVAGYFQASGRVHGGLPPKSHMNDPLLLINNSLSENNLMTSIKRIANSAFASALMHEMSQRQGKKVPVDDKKQAETDLKFAFATYLRLNCSKEDLDRIKAWRYHKYPICEVEALCQAYLGHGSETATDIDNSGGKVDYGDWTGGGRKEAIFEKALSKCKDLFPNLTPNFFSKKASASSRSKKESLAGDVNDPIPGNSTRNSTMPATEASTGDEMVHMSYEVVVPAGLSPGQSFLTTINVGGTKKRFRLTVPDTNPSTLRFKTRIPKSLLLADAPAPKKPRTEGPGESAPGTTTGQGQDTSGQT